MWERAHLEQMMFALAREHAEAAARCARATPPDREGEQTHSLVSLLMSFLALEAFINMVGGDRLGSRYRHYDRMSPEGKWLEVTRLVSKTGRTFVEDGKDLRALSTLRIWRNLLTHYKGEYEEVQQAGRGGETTVEALLTAENAARAVEIARTLYRAFYEMDRRSPPRQFIWLDDSPHRPTGASTTAAAAAAAAVHPGRGVHPERRVHPVVPLPQRGGTPHAPHAGGGRGGRPPAERSGDRQGGRGERGVPAAPNSPGPAPAPGTGQGPVRPRRRRRR
ncbi:MAG: hypothetical protein E6H04_05035 [Bacillati bacterium ANGP1]|uniref:Uncharacterized protein n=1 Tax=Candidatus Segetimicrobium genomatis TaxID=2569760 RepID=A0A537JG38_9BACT|nr:MAG: hypothetical protein E6H04_05035 [Terrabacteria group bacterium ANGP1]